MEIGTILTYCVAVFGNLTVESLNRIVRSAGNGIFGTYGKTSSAADAFVMVDCGNTALKLGTAVSTYFVAGFAADTESVINDRFAFAVHIHFAAS